MALPTKPCEDCGSRFVPITGNQKRCNLCRGNHTYKKKSVKREITCAHCGDTFISAVYNRKFCSDKCRKNYHYQIKPFSKKCAVCGETYTATRVTSLYCSPYCAKVAIARRRKVNDGR